MKKRTHGGLKELFIPGFLDASHVFFMGFLNMFSPVHWKKHQCFEQLCGSFPILAGETVKTSGPMFPHEKRGLS